jgi:nitrite reductase/ring-hydroxylating ferredoxin subunit
MKNRRDFLKTTCPTVAFAIFGVSLIQACSSSDEPMPNPNPDGSSPINNDNGGVTLNGNTATIDLSHSNFSGIASVGGWMNLTAAGLLLLRVSSTTIRAFDNCCPHQGTKTQWTFNNNNFTCNNHGNTFGTGSNQQACSSGASSGDLTEFSAVLSGDTLTVTKS